MGSAAEDHEAQPERGARGDSPAVFAGFTMFYPVLPGFLHVDTNLASKWPWC